MSLENPKVTVLMPVYNGEQYLREAIESILTQSFTDFEFLIINDGSTDSSVEIIESYDDPRIRLIHNEANLKLVATLNKGVDLARGEYIARMDCDDISLPQRLAKQAAFLDANLSCSVIAVKIILVGANKNVIGEWKGDRKSATPMQIYRRLPRINCIAHPGVMMRKSVVSKYRYNPVRRHAEDYDLWLRLLSDGYGIDKINESLLEYRVHIGQVTAVNNEVGLGLANIKAKASLLREKAARLKLNRFDLNVCVGLLIDVAAIVPKFVIKSIFRHRYI